MSKGNSDRSVFVMVGNVFGNLVNNDGVTVLGFLRQG